MADQQTPDANPQQPNPQQNPQPDQQPPAGIAAEAFRPVARAFYDEVNAVVFKYLVQIAPGPDALTLAEAQGVLDMLASSLAFSLLWGVQENRLLGEVSRTAGDASAGVLTPLLEAMQQQQQVGDGLRGFVARLFGEPSQQQPDQNQKTHNDGDAWKPGGGQHG
jgi:hypothetical protein